MNPIELLATSCEGNLELLKTILGDFSDADMLVRPCPGANHAAWQLGHLANSETSVINMAAPGTMPALPVGFGQRFSRDTAGSDDPSAFGTKSELLDVMAGVRKASVAWLRSLSPQDLDAPGPQRLLRIAPTLGHLGLFLVGHTTMHIGQMQVIRRRLGKAVLF